MVPYGALATPGLNRLGGAWLSGYGREQELEADRLGAELAKFPPFARAQIGAIENDPKRVGKRFSVTITLAERGETE